MNDAGDSAGTGGTTGLSGSNGPGGVNGLGGTVGPGDGWRTAWQNPGLPGAPGSSGREGAGADGGSAAPAPPVIQDIIDEGGKVTADPVYKVEYYDPQEGVCVQPAFTPRSYIKLD